MQVASEAELNQAIADINNGGQDTTIEISETIVLTADLTSISADLQLTSASGAVLQANIYRVLNITNGATVTLSSAAGGTGVNLIENGALVGLGGEIGNLTFGDNGTLSVPENQTFTTGGIVVNELGKLDLRGTLQNSAPVTLHHTVEFMHTCQVQGIVVADKAALAVQSDATLTAADFKVDGGLVNVLGTLVTDGTVHVMASSYLSGNQGVIGDVFLQNGDLTNSANHGFTVGRVTNDGGTLRQGFYGTIAATSYTQTSGTLEVTLDQQPFELSAGTLAASDSVSLQGGRIHIKAAAPQKIAYQPGLTFDIVTAANGVDINPGVQFETTGFPSPFGAILHRHPDKLTLEIVETTPAS